MDLLQNMEFPNLDGDLLIDDIINKCWHNRYAMIAELATYTETLLPERKPRSKTNTEPTFDSRCRISEVTQPEVADAENPDGFTNDMGQDYSTEDFGSKRTFCQSLEKRGLLDMLTSGEPEQLGFTLEWYRYSKS